MLFSYSYGLKIATLSSKKLGDSYEDSLKNNYLYQGAFSELDDDIGWTDFALRNYDAQIGRWVQQDPYQEYASGYLAMGDDPVNLIDPSGGFTLGGLTKAGTVAVMTIGGAIIGTVVGLVSGDDDFTGTLIGAGAGLAAGLGSLIQQITLSMGIHTMNAAVDIIDLPINTEQAGKQELFDVIARSTNRMNQEDMMESDGDPDTFGPIGQMFANNEGFAKDKVNDLINLGTKDASPGMRKVAVEMFQQFMSKAGGDYSSQDLNDEINNDKRYKDFLEAFKKKFEERLTRAKGDINTIINSKIDITDIVPTFGDPFTGLGITVDAINYTNVVLTKFAINPKGKYTATVQVHMYDSFGLDTKDINNFGKSNGLANFIKRTVVKANFIAWWVLQHVKGYKHLDTKIWNTATFSGTIKK